jgi:hypothetical protein
LTEWSAACRQIAWPIDSVRPTFLDVEALWEEPAHGEQVYGGWSVHRGVLPMRFIFIRRVFQRRRRESFLDLGQFGLDVREVMLERTSLAITGKLSEAEARRMVLEKQSAAIRAQLAYGRALMKGDPASGNREVFDIYRSAVQSNRKRLRKLRCR